MKFGIQLWQEEFRFNALRDAYINLESMNFDSVWLYDHFYPMTTSGSYSILEPYIALSALAMVTKTTRLGVLVTCNSFRHPSVLAKIAASLDVISGGRLEFAIGAGWFEDEYVAYGIPFPEPSVRIGQLGEAVQVIRELWTKDKVDFKGKYYELKGAICEPKPIQKPHPPIWIGGRGEKLTLKVVAKYGDYSNFGYVSPKECRHLLEVLKRHCAQVGRNFDDIKKSWHGVALLGSNEREIRKQVGALQRSSVSKYLRQNSLNHYLERMISGTPEKCIEQIQKYIDLGITYFIVYVPSCKTRTESASLFAREVIRAFK